MSQKTVTVGDVDFVFEPKEDNSVFVAISKKGQRDVVYFDMTKEQSATLGGVFKVLSK